MVVWYISALTMRAPDTREKELREFQPAGGLQLAETVWRAVGCSSVLIGGMRDRSHIHDCKA